MFNPKYTITNRLFSNIKKINSTVSELNHRRFPKPVLYELEKNAREVSAFASTSIEGNPLPLTDVKLILKSQPENLRKSEQEVVNYNRALEILNEKLSRGKIAFNLSLILSIHRQIMKKLVPEHQRGKIRREPVFVNDPRLKKTVYWPPDHKDVFPLMTELVYYIRQNKQTVDPLIAAGIFHRQFVIIHPFADGNGRTVRLATKVLLAEMGLNTFNLFSFENYYNRNVTNYFGKVGAAGNYYDMVDSLDFTQWLEYFADGIVDELARVKKLLPEISLSPRTTLKPYHQKLIAYVTKKGFIADSDYAKITKRAKATRNLDFNKLIDMGLIERKGKGKATYYRLRGM